MRLTLEVVEGKQTRSMVFTCRRMLNAGYVGRDSRAVTRHIEELRSQGVHPPHTIPCLYPVDNSMLTTGSKIEVFSGETSGEAEYVLFVEDGDKIFVGVGSDHTDRFLEKTDIARSKRICPNIISPKVWPLGDVIDHWDELLIRSHALEKGDTILYQEGRLESIISPNDLLTLVGRVLPRPYDGLIVFSGTLEAVAGRFVIGEGFSAELIDSCLNRRLSLEYEICNLESLILE